ncbi:MAG: hypothetical protein MZW92_64610 [Comamonadaceae bacterium]|nr:hypothetical protein [Comamonadaceae bacterium]
MPDAVPSRILIVRRDNIGDLVCTTPMIRMLRRHHPDAWIAALVTRYNAEVLAGNPDRGCRVRLPEGEAPRCRRDPAGRSTGSV